MKALILNSGLGSRMGVITNSQPKCMTQISENETIISRQLKLLADEGIKEVVITTGPFADTLEVYCNSLELPIDIEFVNNPEYKDTNYIYSINCASKLLRDDIILMHGDLVFSREVLACIINEKKSCMAVSSSAPLPEKDFKAVIVDGRIEKVGIEFFDNAVAAQPLYKLNKADWLVWLEQIENFCSNGDRKCYAENAFNTVSDRCEIVPLDVNSGLCSEIDNLKDLNRVIGELGKYENKLVYMSFSTDILHGGHIDIIKKASSLGRLVIGVLSDEAIANYKRFPLVPFEERRAMFDNIKGVSMVVRQDELSYRTNLCKLKPDIVVHGDDWQQGVQKPIRDEVVDILAGYGGELKEFPYSDNPVYKELEKRARAELALPDTRRGRLKKLLNVKNPVTALEAHSGITGLIVENTVVNAHQFDAMWVSSLCDSTAKGKPDIELVDLTSRLKTVDEIMEVTTKPVIFDGDTGGLTEHFVYTVKTLERMGVSMIIVEDKKGLKKNSLFGTEVPQEQEYIDSFCEKIAAGKKAQKSHDFMICARIESLILEKGMEDALKRAKAYTGAGADAIMIHSRKKEPDEIYEFLAGFRQDDNSTPVVVVPSSYSVATEEELAEHGANIVIYANQLTRTGIPAMKKAAESILENHRAKECDEMCMPIKEIITLIPEEI